MLGFGFATPYLGAIGEAERVLAFMPAGQGVIDWPAGGAAARRRRWWRRIRCRFPIPRIDLVILVHALEMSTRPNALMAELRRVLTSGGRLIVVVPNRQGPWATLRPFALRLRPALFARPAPQPFRGGRASRRRPGRPALHMPPAAWRPLLGAARALDRIGRLVWPAFAGVIVVSAVKRTVQGIGGAGAAAAGAGAPAGASGRTSGVAGRLPP